MSYDPRCAELAMYFLDDQPTESQTPEVRATLAQVIQDAIEGYLLDLEAQRRVVARRQERQG